MQGQALADYLHTAESGLDPKKSVALLLADLKVGKIRHEDIFAHYKAENMPKLNSMTRIFGEGNLFRAQRQAFPAWLEGQQWKQDYQTALDFRALEDMCQTQVYAVDHFICKMVMPNGPARKRLAEQMGGENVLLTRWSGRLIKEGWRWHEGA